MKRSESLYWDKKKKFHLTNVFPWAFMKKEDHSGKGLTSVKETPSSFRSVILISLEVSASGLWSSKCWKDSCNATAFSTYKEKEIKGFRSHSHSASVPPSTGGLVNIPLREYPALHLFPNLKEVFENFEHIRFFHFFRKKMH